MEVLKTPNRVKQISMKLKQDLNKIKRQCLDQSTTFLSNQIQKIVHTQIKQQRIKQSISKDLQKCKHKLRKFGTQEIRENVRKFRIQQREKLIKNFDNLKKEESKRQEKVKLILSKNMQLRERKQKQNKEHFQKVKQKAEQFYISSLQKINNYQFDQRNSFQRSLRSKNSMRSISSDKYSKTKQLMQRESTKSQNGKITNYIRKLRRMNERSLHRDLSHPYRPVQCRSSKRDQKIHNLNIKFEQQYNKKINRFSKNRSFQTSMQQSTINVISENRQEQLNRALQKKQIINKQNIERILTQFNLKNKKIESWNQKNSKQIRDKQNQLIVFSRYKYKTKMSEMKVNHQKRINYIQQKTNQIKQMDKQQVIKEKEAQRLLKLIDKSSSNFNQIKEFLNTTKEVSINNRLKKILEKSTKSAKVPKN